jgi:hypothetical protein
VFDQVYTNIYDFVQNKSYDIIGNGEKTECQTRPNYFQQDLFDINVFHEAKFGGYQVINGTQAVVFENLYTGGLGWYIQKLYVDAFSQKPVVVDFAGFVAKLYITKYEEGKQPDYEFDIPKDLKCYD